MGQFLNQFERTELMGTIQIEAVPDSLHKMSVLPSLLFSFLGGAAGRCVILKEYVT